MKKAVAYITNPDKTDEQKFVSSFGCSPETADLEFAMTAEMGKNNVMEKGDNLAWHMIISYHPNDLRNNIRQSTSCMILPFRNYLVLE